MVFSSDASLVGILHLFQDCAWNGLVAKTFEDMPTTQLLGALLILSGLIYMAVAAIYRGRMSNPNPTASGTLEPRRAGLRFLGFGINWPGLLLVVLGGAVMLLSAAGP